MYKKTTLDNGVQLISYNLPSMQSVAVGIWLKVGGRYENFEQKGISHYLEHLLFKGSKKYSCRQIKETIEGVGGSLNGFTSEELTCYLAKLPARHLSEALNILSDMVSNPLLSAEEIEKERTVILEELKMYRDLPQSHVYDLLDELLWPKQPLGASIIGTIESINGITQVALRSYQQTHYTPRHTVVSVVGKCSHTKLISQIEKAFGRLNSERLNSFSPARELQEAAQLKILVKETEQSHLALGFHGFKRDHPRRHALGLLNIILGGNMSSRLFNEVREKRGLTYEIGSLTKRFSDTGAFLVHAGMDNSNVSKAIKVILEELGRTKDTLVSEDEFKRAKEFYLGQLMLALEDTLDYMLWLGESVSTLSKAYTLQDIVREVNSVKRQELRAVANEIFKQDHLNVSLVGPLEGKDSEVRQAMHI